jgi:hypothetical protein
VEAIFQMFVEGAVKNPLVDIQGEAPIRIVAVRGYFGDDQAKHVTSP